MNHDELKLVVRYEPDTGHFVWVLPRSTKLKPGRRAGTPHGNGYRRIDVLGVRVFEHRLAWFYMTGAWPEADIDHINGIRDDNRWLNLRAATRTENNLNLRGAPKRQNKTGVLGVSKTKSGTFFARLKVSGKVRHLGSFSTAEAAGNAYQAELIKRSQR